MHVSVFFLKRNVLSCGFYTFCAEITNEIGSVIDSYIETIYQPGTFHWLAQLVEC